MMPDQPNENELSLQEVLEKGFQVYEDFPKQGVIFQDFSPILASPKLFARVIQEMSRQAIDLGATKIVGIECRGFLVGQPLAFQLGIPFVPARKKGKLPGPVYKQDYDLEYGTDSIEVQQERVQKGDRFLIVDDVIATGGTAAAAARCIEAGKAEVAGFSFLMEIEYLRGVQKLQQAFPQATIWSVLKST